MIFITSVIIFFTEFVGKRAALDNFLFVIFLFILWVLIVNLPAWLVMRLIVIEEKLSENSEEKRLTNFVGMFYVKRQR